MHAIPLGRARLTLLRALLLVSLVLTLTSLSVAQGTSQSQTAPSKRSQASPAPATPAPPPPGAQQPSPSKPQPQPPTAEKPPPLKIATVTHNKSMWVSVGDAAKALHFQVQYLPQQHRLEATRGSKHVTTALKGSGSYWTSFDQRGFVPLSFLQKLGYGVRWSSQAHHAVITWGSHTGLLTYQPKTISVNLRRQVLFAREGNVVIYKFRVSTGRQGYITPDGSYQVLRKEAMHISNEYPKPNGGAKMPYALWFTTAYYIHGYHSVPHHPASHGCVRVSIPNARLLYSWASIGTPVKIYRTPQE